MHTPLGKGTWEVGLQQLQPGHRRPWRVRETQAGHWQVEASGNVRSCEDVAEAPPPQVECPVELPEELEEVDDLEAHDPQLQEAEIAEEGEEAPIVEPPPEPPQQLQVGATFSVECWSLAENEEAVVRLDRVLKEFLKQFALKGVVVPNNIRRLEKCSDQHHSDCFVFSFGTRRLHMHVREGQGGKLSLVLRCGGGFLDFAGFALRHGSGEMLKLDRAVRQQGGGTLRLSSVLVGGTVQVRKVKPTPR
mmetsp:Transcript_131717/g.421438  ORF Transcript_131717/g.421438 Transcript_131717/m.421438 type:complete len:248 (+) Transcript_131717:1011-1754(+)